MNYLSWDQIAIKLVFSWCLIRAINKFNYLISHMRAIIECCQRLTFRRTLWRHYNAIGKIFDAQLKEVMSDVSLLKAKVLYLKNANAALTTRLDSLEAYNWREILIITGLPVGSFAEAATTSNQRSVSNSESSLNTEKLHCHSLMMFFSCTVWHFSVASLIHKVNKYSGNSFHKVDSSWCSVQGKKVAQRC